MMARIPAWVLGIEIVLMVPALAIAIFTGDGPAIKGFLWSMLIMLVVAGLLAFVSRNAERGFYAQEGMVCVGLCWIIMSALGALPFFISGRVPNYIDCLFETVSGFTTTGASILTAVEPLGKGLLYWRSFTHWVGGMGILVFFLAIIPTTGKNKNDGFTLHILRAESPGPSVNKMVPRMRESASILYILYCVLTVLDILFLKVLGGMPWFDSFCIAYGTAGTGGFGVLSSSMGEYSAAAQNVTTIFMLLFGVNFGLYYFMVMKKFAAAFKDEELRLYLAIVVVATVVIAINVFGKTAATAELEPTIRHSAFTVASIITTTGYSTTDFNTWPTLSKAILLMLMICGASAGSTGGGIKVARVLYLFKALKRNIHQIFHPNEIMVVRFNGQRVNETTVNNTNSYLAAYCFIVVFSFLLVSGDPGNFSMETNFSAILATFNNIGPGFDIVGATGNYSAYSGFSKLVMTGGMLLGRLEIFPILAIFAPSTYWRN